MLEKGFDNQPADKHKAASYFKMAADKGDVNAMFKYATMLENGEGVAVNKEQAIYYYKIANDKENENSI